MSQGSTQASNQPTAFNLIMEGVGYLNRVRQVEVRKGPAYLACTVNAIMGTTDSVEYVSIDLKVVGKQAMQVVEQLAKDTEARRKVLIGFRASDPKPEFYEFEDSKTKQMVQREGLKARLLQVTFAKVDGQRQDIPLVERPANPGDAQQAAVDSADGAGSACDDTSRVPAQV